MDFLNYRQVGFNALAAFAFAFFTALGTGAALKVAAVLGVGAVVANLSGLFQKQPHKD